ncbi:stage V sporulation protein AD [Carboxydocella sporoproducens DSM 16521]|uniref:Stage V sporulation protein AD n=2 Tax=Carboxydocella TaxID=178898 RepID=A0A1T4MTJ1_9FIRM|nr:MULTISPECIES: stage V sporulation protein AD [Carboxydocella]AVX20346.1 stage V sporulation protein AD [Carboxydocella thermautotrophica]SJZ69958.1 stage V sporulation protein AD [Carboxydocella sporoproducens DSM 16521]
MKGKKIGKQTIQFANPPVILATATTAGPMEAKGPLGTYYSLTYPDQLIGQKSWEQAERKMLKDAVELAISHSRLTVMDIEFLLAGDLLNQIITANFAARDLGIPLIGLYGACSTMALGLALGAMIIDGGFARHLVVAASSHYDTAERQYRYPTELGTQRPMTAQWTVTGAGAMVLGAVGEGLYITHATIGKVMDLGQDNPNDMGSAMAPAVADTILTHFGDTGRSPADYDLIISGDLASIGKALCERILKEAGFDVTNKYTDAGILVYDPIQDVHAGGSGCGCSAIVWGSWLYQEMLEGRFKRVLLVGSGSLHSPISVQQGETIPGIGHAIAVERL